MGEIVDLFDVAPLPTVASAAARLGCGRASRAFARRVGSEGEAHASDPYVVSAMYLAGAEADGEALGELLVEPVEGV